VERPIIGIATQTQHAVPGRSPLAWIMGQRYVRALTDAGAVPWIIPLLPDEPEVLRQIYDRLHGLLLTGGVDVDPVHYAQARRELCGESDPARDATELLLLRWALAEGKPIFGICRGIQILNVACGGTLYQDIAAELPGALKHDYFPTPARPQRDLLVHPARVLVPSRLGSILQVEEVQVNSMHHQGIRELGRGLRATAFAPDGLIEGVEGANGQFLVAVQWHPEELVDTQAPMRRLFEAFVAAASGWTPAVPL
jgi:putative glutamine amidotransferase